MAEFLENSHFPREAWDSVGYVILVTLKSDSLNSKHQRPLITCGLCCPFPHDDLAKATGVPLAGLAIVMLNLLKLRRVSRSRRSFLPNIIGLQRYDSPWGSDHEWSVAKARVRKQLVGHQLHSDSRHVTNDIPTYLTIRIRVYLGVLTKTENVMLADAKCFLCDFSKVSDFRIGRKIHDYFTGSNLICPDVNRHLASRHVFDRRDSNLNAAIAI
jgi:hypothetical protein